MRGNAQRNIEKIPHINSSIQAQGNDREQNESRNVKRVQYKIKR